MTDTLDDTSKDPVVGTEIKPEISKKRLVEDKGYGNSPKVCKVEDNGISEIYSFAKKLLVCKSPNMDDDWKRMSELREKYGTGFTRKVEAVFNDIVESKSIMYDFEEDKKMENMPAEIYVNVLRKAYWPSHLLMELRLPSAMITSQRVFADFYRKKYNKRKLEWQPRLSYCLLRAFFPKGKKELLVSLFQALVLLAFNEADELSLDEIKRRTNIAENDLKNTLQSLACKKFRVLHQHPQGREVCDGNIFSFNKDFYFKGLYRIKMITVKITNEEQQQIEEGASQQCERQVDIAIIKIMKSKQVVSKEKLVSEVQGQLKFPAEPGDIKKRIETLIDLNYLECNREEPNNYSYIT